MDRRPATIEFRYRTVFGSEFHKRPLEQFEQASTQGNYSSNGQLKSRVAFILTDTPKKEIRNLTPGYGGAAHAEDMAKLINAWAQNGANAQPHQTTDAE